MVDRATLRSRLEPFIAPVGANGVASGSPPYRKEERKQLIDTFAKKDAAGKISTPGLKPAVTNNKTYTDLCGLTHEGQVINWCANGANNGQLTSCNSFVGMCSARMGSKVSLSAFRLHELVAQHGRAHSFIRPSSGEKPQYGDIFTHYSTSELHMGVSLGFDENNTWKTIEGGQGGPGTGVDFIKRKDRTWDPTHWDGWVDMTVFLDTRGPVPDWLTGTWVIYSGSDMYYYRVDRRWEVEQLPWKPQPGSLGGAQSLPVMDRGAVTMLPGDRFEIRWAKEGWIESFEYLRWESFPGIMERVKGKTSRGEAMRGVRL